jgi:DNA mismatch repair protein MutH
MSDKYKNLPYDRYDPKDIERYAKKLVGKRFRDVIEKDSQTNLFEYQTDMGNLQLKEAIPQAYEAGNKGHLGQFIEQNYFLYNPNSNKEADFKEAGVELKVTPLKILSKGKTVAKERIVLNIINYMEIVTERWENSSFLDKNALLLLIFYLYENDKEHLDYFIKMATLWDYGDRDIEIIKQDWQKIVAKIREGKAHELSEGDTMYLGACTKGANCKYLRIQPFSNEPAKQRAFGLKIKYVNSIISQISEAEPAIKTLDEFSEGKTFEDIILDKIKEYSGSTVEQIHKKKGEGLNPRAKNYYSSLAARMIGIKKNKIEEFEKGDVEVKTIRLKANGRPKEDMSFRYFKYKEIVNESWEESTFLEQLEHRFFFMIFQYNKDKELIFKKGMFWTIPYQDLKEVEKVWKETVKRIEEGKASDLPKSSENRVSHIRPHGRNSEDTCETPQGEHVVKKCFWLNAEYLKEQIEMDDNIKNISETN